MAGASGKARGFFPNQTFTAPQNSPAALGSWQATCRAAPATCRAAAGNLRAAAGNLRAAAGQLPGSYRQKV